MEHTYVQIDKDGTVECTECGLRNSDPTRQDSLLSCRSNDYINCKK